MFKVVYESANDDNHFVVVSDEEFDAERARLDCPEYLPRIHADGLSEQAARSECARVNALGQKEVSR